MSVQILQRPSPDVVLAIPTLKARDPAAKETAAIWQQHTCQPLRVIVSYAPGGWSAGLNDAWEQVRMEPPLAFVCGSDDMEPEDDNWLPPLLDLLQREAFPAPTVIDPRWTNYGGHVTPVPDGTPSDMSSFPVIHGSWGDAIFPLPESLSYYADNLISVKVRQLGKPCVACPSSRIVHRYSQIARGFGHENELAALRAHEELFEAELVELGIDRRTLPPLLAGPRK